MCGCTSRSISIHALREEGDLRTACLSTTRTYFYPRPPRGGRRDGDHLAAVIVAISIHALREEGDHAKRTRQQREPISIHALREEGDTATTSPRGSPSYFYPRPPRGGRPHWRRRDVRPEHNFYPRPPRGGRRDGTPVTTSNKKFLSTPSARRATAKTETKSLFSYKLYNILHEFRRALIYNGSKNYPNHAK